VESDATQPFANPNRGIFIVLEGTDGSGKGTQFEILTKQLRAAGHDVVTFDFPQYESPSSYFVKRYLNGEYGEADAVGPYTGSLFYALDRYDAAPAIKQALADGKVVLANRFTASNMAHQGTKFDSAEQRRGYFVWLDNLEFETLGIPRPDLNIVLRVPAETAQQLVDQKAERSYTDKKRDLHEADINHLRKAVTVYDDLCQLFPKDFSRIDCVRNNELLGIETISKLIRQKLEPMLPPVHVIQQQLLHAPTEPAKQPETPSVTANPYVEKQAGITKLTEAGNDYLATAVTNTTGNVYGFTDTFSPVTIAAAMARLSRRGDDMRLTLMDEFAHALSKDNKRKDEQLLHRVITAYGDDSVQQLVGIPIVVEEGSNLLAKKLEWGRLAAYLEQSTRYIFFDEKDAQGNYKYYIPQEFDPATRKAYVQSMDGIFERYSRIVRQMTEYVREHDSTPANERDGAWKAATKAQACDLCRALLPISVKATIGIYASGQALEAMIMRLLADDLPEAQQAGQNILDEARKVVPAFLERADKPERGGATVAYLANTRHAVEKLAADILPPSHNSDPNHAVTLTDVWPRNELDIVPEILYSHSSLSLAQLRQETDTWSYDRKAGVLEAYFGERLNRRHRPGRALEKIHYSWDIFCDYGTFKDLQRHRIVDAQEWQILTPRYGYEVPGAIDQAGLSDLFEECFDMSLRLHSMLQQNGYTNQAQYAVLHGHRMRWKVTYNAREAFHLHELRTSPQGHPTYRKLVLQMHDKLAEVHPILASAMKFVNQGENPELTRLAAERYTQFKLQNLDPQTEA